MWMIVLMVCTANSCSQTPLLGLYTAEEKCVAAGEAYLSGRKLLSSTTRSYTCIPAPDNYGFE